MRSLLLTEVLFVLVLCAGVAFIFWPAALMLGGLLGVVACERASAAARLPDNVRPLRRDGRGEVA